jgi:hypothetical protein
MATTTVNKILQNGDHHSEQNITKWRPPQWTKYYKMATPTVNKILQNGDPHSEQNITAPPNEFKAEDNFTRGGKTVKKNVKLSLCTPRKQSKEVAVQLHPFLNSALGGGDWPHMTPQSPYPRRKTRYVLNTKLVDLKSVSTYYRRRKSLAPARIQTPDRQFRSLIAISMAPTRLPYGKGKSLSLQAWTGLREVKAPRISRHSAHEGGKVVSPTHRPSLRPGKIPGTHFC